MTPAAIFFAVAVVTGVPYPGRRSCANVRPAAAMSVKPNAILFSISIPPPWSAEGNYAFGAKLVDSRAGIAERGEHLARVLADFRWVHALRETLAVHFDRQRRNIRALSHVPGLEQSAGCLEVRVVEQVPGLGDRCERHADRLELRRQLVGGMFLRDLVDPRDEPRAFLDAHAVRLESLVSSQIINLKLAAKDLPLRVGDDADEQSAAA